MAISEARQQQLLAGCNSLEAKLFEFVPIQEVWSAEQINRQMQTAGKSGAEHKRVRAALGGLKDRGLIKEVKRDAFQREPVKIRELREAVSDIVTPPKLGDFMDAKALRKIAVPYVPPKPVLEIAESMIGISDESMSILRDSAMGRPVSVESVEKAIAEKSTQNAAQIKPEPEPIVVKETVEMNAIAKTAADNAPTAADIALEALNELSQEMETLNNEFGARMNALRERMSMVALEVEELRDHETKALGKFRAFKALMTTLSDD
jgi:hypothetical protein